MTERRADEPGAEGRPSEEIAAAAEPAGGEPQAARNEPAAATPAAEPAVDFRDRWLRAEAELQNYRRRAQRDLEESRRIAEENVMLEIIAAVDDLERAIAAASAAEAPESWTSGVKLVASRLGEYLARQGVNVVDPAGEPFDPAFHEALLEVDAPEGAAPGSVVQVVHKGYRRGPRALRAARVVVAKRAAAGGA